MDQTHDAVQGEEVSHQDAVDQYEHSSPQSFLRQSPTASHNMDAPQSSSLLPPNQRTSPTLSEKTALLRSLKGKEKEWIAVAEKKRPLQLLDMPVDILKEIIEKVSPASVRHDLNLTSPSYHIPTTSPHFRYATLYSMRLLSRTSTLVSTLCGPTTLQLRCKEQVWML
jgi:hypothetical protein